MPSAKVQWATVKRSVGPGKKVADIPYGSKCLACVATLSTWPDLSWQEAVSRAKSQPGFAATVSEAKKVWKSRGDIPQPPWLPECLGEEKVVGVRVKRQFLVFSAEDLEEKFGTGAAQNPELQWEEVNDEFGQKLRVVLVKPPAPSRSVTYESCTHLRLQTEVSKPDHMIRPRQHADLMVHMTDKQKKRGYKGLSQASLEESAEKFAKMKEEPHACMPPPAPLVAHDTQTSTEAAGEEIVTVAHMSASGMADMLGERESKKGKKGEGKARGKGQISGSKKRAAATASESGSVYGEAKRMRAPTTMPSQSATMSEGASTCSGHTGAI